MSLTELPVEMLEEIFQYLDTEDMVNAWKAVSMDGREAFWAKVCRRKGYTKLEGAEDGWREAIHCELNWRSGQFVERDCLLENAKSLIHLMMCNSIQLHHEHLLLGYNDSDHNSGLEVFNIDDTSTPTQTIEDVVEFRVCGSKLLVSNQQIHRIYELMQGQYIEIYRTNHGGLFQSDLSDDFFVFENKELNQYSIDIVNLATLRQYYYLGQRFPKPLFEITAMSISGPLLIMDYILENIYSVVRYSLKQGICLKIYNMTSNVSFDTHNFSLFTTKQLEVHRVGINSVDTMYSSKLYVFGTFERFFTVLWVSSLIAVREQYIVYTSTDTDTLNIRSGNPTCLIPKVLFLDRSMDECLQKDVVCTKESHPLLILTFPGRFKVIDIAKATYLYDIKVMVDQKLDPVSDLEVPRYFVNERFYVLYLGMEVQKPQHRSPVNECTGTLEIVNSFMCEMNQPLIEKKVAMFICDFRSEV